MENWEYETKCRRCGSLTDWFFSGTNMTTWLEFSKAMINQIQFPRTHKCQKCKKKTVQDVVSHTEQF